MSFPYLSQQWVWRFSTDTSPTPRPENCWTRSSSTREVGLLQHCSPRNWVASQTAWFPYGEKTLRTETGTWGALRLAEKMQINHSFNNHTKKAGIGLVQNFLARHKLGHEHYSSNKPQVQRFFGLYCHIATSSCWMRLNSLHYSLTVHTWYSHLIVPISSHLAMECNGIVTDRGHHHTRRHCFRNSRPYNKAYLRRIRFRIIIKFLDHWFFNQKQAFFEHILIIKAQNSCYKVVHESDAGQWTRY